MSNGLNFGHGHHPFYLEPLDIYTVWEQIFLCNL